MCKKRFKFLLKNTVGNSSGKGSCSKLSSSLRAFLPEVPSEQLYTGFCTRSRLCINPVYMSH